MNDALLMRGREAVGDLNRVVGDLAHRQRGQQLLSQGLAFEQLFDDERGRALAADVVDGEDVRVIERGGRERFLLEPAQPIGVTCD